MQLRPKPIAKGKAQKFGYCILIKDKIAETKKFIALMISITIIFSIGNFPISATIIGDNYSGNGNWIINNPTTVENETIILNGNLLIYDSLTFKNTTLIVNSSFNGEYKIEVFNGGAFYIYNNSNITSMNETNNYNFFVNDGGILVMKNSKLSYCGYYVYDENETYLYFNVKNAGLWINGNVIVENSSFYKNYIGLAVQTENAKIENNNFSENSYGTLFYYAINNSLKQNYIADNTFGVFMFNSNYINAEGNKLQNNSLQIYVDRINYTTIKGNEINNTNANDSDYGIVIWRSENNTIFNNSFIGNNGIYLYYSLNAKNTIANNTINVENNGFFIYNAAENSILNNTITTQTLGFFFDFNSFYNYVENNSVNSDLYYHILNKNNLTFNNLNLQNDKVSNLGKITLINSENITIKNSVFAKNSYYGLYLYNSSYNIIENNTMNLNNVGIYIENCKNNSIKNNSLNANNELGIFFADENSYYNNIEENTIDEEKYYHLVNANNLTLNNLNLQTNFATNLGKISLIDSENITIDGSTIANNTYGIFAFNSNYIKIANSKIKNCNYGVYLGGSYANISENEITENIFGIYLNGENNFIRFNNLSYSYENAIYLNGNDNFIGNNELNNSVSGIIAENSSDNSVFWNYINFNSLNGVELNNSNNNQIKYNEFINNSYCGIYLLNSNDNNIQENAFNYNYIGIFNELTNTNTMKSNTINSSLNIGIYLYDSDDNSIQQNIITNSSYGNISYGIRISNSDNTLIEENNISYNYYGIFSESSLSQILFNEFYNNSENGIYLSNSNSNEIKNNLLNNSNGIKLENSALNNLENNTLFYNYYGIYLYNSDNNIIKNSIASYSNSYGIYLRSSENNEFENISANYNDYGIYSTSSQNNKMNAIANNNNKDGIYLINSDNNEINLIANYNYHGIFMLNSNNNNFSINISNNSWGVYSLNSQNNFYENSNISYNNYGIWLYSSLNDTIKNNDFYKNYRALTLESSNSNYIYLNNFISNNFSCLDDGNNIWNLSYGNYFSNYNGEDSNSDGIGDAPYSISGGNNKDYLPLIVKIGDPFVSNTSHFPISPLSYENIEIYAKVIDIDNDIISVILYYFADGNWQNIAMNLNSNYSAEINGFNENEIIQYYIKAIDRKGNYNISTLKVISIQNAFPNSVVLTYENLTSSSLILKWTKNNNSDFANYTIMISEDSLTWNYFANIIYQNTTSYLIENLIENTQLYFKIVVWDLYDLFNESNAINITTLNAVPRSVFLNYSSLTSSSVVLNWTKNNNSDFANYIIMISEDNSTWNEIANITNQNTTSYLINSLSENTDYYLKIFVYDMGNLYNESNIINITTLNGKPNSVSLSYANLTSKSLTLIWTENNNSDFANYKIYKSSDGNNWQFIIEITNQNTIFYNVENLTENTNYYFKIVVYDVYNSNNQSGIISIKTLNIAPNSSVMNVLETKYTSIKLTWTKNTNNDFKNYTLFMSINSSDIGIVIYSTTNRDANVYTVSDLNQNTTYYFTLRVYDSGNLYSESKISNKTLAMPNQKPNVYVVSHHDNDKISGEVKISGTASDDKGVIKVEFRIDNENWQTANGAAFWHFYWNTTKYTNGNHRFSVRSYDGELYSEELLIVLNVQNIVGEIPNSVFLSVLQTTKNSIKVKWTKNNDIDFSSYQILISEDGKNWNLYYTIKDRNIIEYSISDLKENTEYSIKIKVVDSDNLSSDSNIVSATTKKEEKFIEDVFAYILVAVGVAVLVSSIAIILYLRRRKNEK